jgi:hypothetical protein
MHDSHDLDLIADYADGSREPAAERLLDSCADCRAELALHQEMRALLAGTVPTPMTDDERAAMRAGVQAGIGQVAPVVPLAARRQSRWLKLGSVAAAVFVTVGVAGVLTQQGGDDAGSDVMAAGQTEETTASADAFVLESASATTAAASTELAPERSSDEATETESTASGNSLPLGGTDAPALGIGILTDAGAVTRAELDGQLEALIDLLSNQTVSEQLDTPWFNDREIPAPSCLTSEVLPVFGVINATIDGTDVQAFVVFDATTSEYRSDILMVEGCTPFE